MYACICTDIHTHTHMYTKSENMKELQMKITQSPSVIKCLGKGSIIIGNTSHVTYPFLTGINHFNSIQFSTHVGLLHTKQYHSYIYQ